MSLFVGTTTGLCVGNPCAHKLAAIPTNRDMC